MANYQRSTRECTIDGMRPELSEALRAHAAQRGLENDIASARMCCETISKREKRGVFRRGEEMFLQAVVLTPAWLIWAVGKVGETPSAFAVRLREIRVEDYESSPMYRRQEDRGVQIFGLKTGEGIGSAFIGLGPEPAAQRFRDLLKTGVEQA